MRWQSILWFILLMALAPQGQADRLKAFQQDRFGMFIHWGVYAIPARGEWVMHNEQIPIEEYEKFKTQFDPQRFDANKVVALAKAAGMKYIIITSKHHDGFCMFDSALTDYTGMHTPARRDFIREMAKACRAQRMKLGFYYSLMDWHHPNYNYRKRPDYPTDWNKYVAYMKGQLRELCTKYGRVYAIWFDGGWDKTPQEWHSQELVEMIRSLQPGILVNDRSGYDGDFSTPEQTVPGAATGEGRAFESCITMNDNWGYNASDTHFKSATDLIRLLVDIASKGGNLLLNVGPKADGAIQPESVDRLQTVGRWMKRNGASIYGTEAGPFHALPFGRSTVKGNRLYLHIFDWPRGSLVLDGLKNRVRSARFLANRQAIPFQQEKDRVEFVLPPAIPDPADTVLAVEVEGKPSADSAVRPQPDGSLILPAMYAAVHGQAARYQASPDSIGYWTDAKDWISWDIAPARAGAYDVEITYACAEGTGDSEYEVRAGSRQVTGKVRETGGWDRFVSERPGRLRLASGPQTFSLRPLAMPGYAVMNLQRIRLIPR